MKAPFPANENERLGVLRRYHVIDTAPEPAFDRVARLAAHILGTPIALVTFVDEIRQFVKSSHGIKISETPRDVAFCAYTILSDDCLIVPDATKDSRFSDNPLVTGGLGIRFYAGAPLKTSAGIRLGAICGIDLIPRAAPKPEQIAMLEELANEVSHELESRSLGSKLDEASRHLTDKDHQLQEQLIRQVEVEARASLALEAGRIGTWHWDASTDRYMFSRLMEELIGFEPGEYDGTYRSWSERIHPDDRQRVIDATLAKQTVEQLTLKFRVNLPNGRVRWLVEKGDYCRDSRGVVVSGNGVCWDVTEKVEFEDRLRTSEEIFRGISASSPVGIFRTDLDGFSIYANPRLCAIWQMNEQEILGYGWVSRLHPDDRATTVEVFGNALVAGQSYARQCRLQLPDGSIRWVHTRATVVYDSAGQPTGSVGTVDDITERIQLEAERQASEQLTQRILESSADCIKVLDLNGNIQLINPGGLRSLGVLDASSLVGANWIKFWKRDQDLEAVGNAIGNALKGGVGAFQGSYQVNNYEERWWDNIITPICDATGKPERLLVISRDITEKEILAQQQDEARKAAESASSAKSLFLANVSHELRTPLNGILGMSALLLDTRLSPEQQEFAETINESGLGLLSIVDELLDFTKLDATRSECKRSRFDLQKIVRTLAKNIAPHAQFKNLQVECDFPQSLPREFIGDEERLRQILLNYLTNALKFTEQGGISLEVRAEPLSSSLFDVLIAVRDTGSGVPEEAQADLFQPFHQLDSSSKRKHGGLGLGLAIAKRLADSMGGSVGLLSNVGQGSTFWVRVPLFLADASAADASLDLSAACTLQYKE